MSRFDSDERFQCDWDTKQEFLELIKRLFKGYDLNVDIPYDPHSTIDVYFTAYTDTVEAAYACELKDRWDYDSTDYGADGQEGWVIEDFKKKVLEEKKEEGYNPIYVNFYRDGVVRIWNLNRVKDFGTTGDKEWKRHTVDNEGGTYRKSKLTVFNKDAKEYDRWN